MSTPKSAADNVVYPMRKLGILDSEGGLTDRGRKWRVDESYADACQEILDEIYPADLAVLTDESGAPDKTRILTWLQHRGLGGSNARQMAATYAMIAEKRIPSSIPSEPKKSTRKPSAKPTSATVKSAPSPASEDLAKPDPLDRERGRGSSSPNLHLDIQIHIPSDASLEQIDQIFASMARHLYQNG
jgi:hypothetical protein